MTDGQTRETRDQGFNWARLCFPPLTRGYERMTGRTGVVSASQGLCDYTSAGPLPSYTTGRIGEPRGAGLTWLQPEQSLQYESQLTVTVGRGVPRISLFHLLLLNHQS